MNPNKQQRSKGKHSPWAYVMGSHAALAEKHTMSGLR